MKKYLALLLICFFGNFIYAQTTDDALRFTLPGIGVNSRALGMGNAFVSVADNFSAVYWNPAGLAQLRTIELSGGFNLNSYNSKTTFQQNISDKNSNGTNIDELGFVLPIPTVRGSLVFAFGYSNITDHNSSLKFSGINSTSSIIPALYDADVKYDIPFQVYLSNKRGYTPIQSGVLQTGTIYNEGSGGQWNFSSAIDIEENFSVGATIYGVSGNYNYDRQYTEVDQNNLWRDTTTFVDSLYRQFKQFNLDNKISTEYSGIGIIAGLLYRSGIINLGVTLKSPFTITSKEVYTDEGTSIFDNGTRKNYKYSAKSLYGISSPVTIAAGISLLPADGFILSTDVETTDWTKLKWADNTELESDNSIFREKFRTTINYRIGVELGLSDALLLRGGYIKEMSPYKNDPSNFNPITITGGFGYKISPSVSLDFAVASKKFSTYHNNYTHPIILNPSRTDENINVTYVNLTLSYKL